MQSIKKRLSVILVICSAVSILLSALLVNLTINRTFSEYMSDIQAKRDERIKIYFEEVYKKEGKWTVTSGIELTHEAYMNNYCLVLRDKDKKVVWGMDPMDIRFKEHFMAMDKKNEGLFTAGTYEIKSGGSIVGYIEIGQYSPILLSKEDVDFQIAVNESIVVSVIITILTAIAVSIALSRQFSRPITQVSDTSVELSKGNYDARSTANSDISEIRNLEESINILGEKLKKQDAIRKRLVSDISHEIRTPLNILQNNIEAMVDGIFPVTNDRLASLNSEVVRFGKLLDNLNALKEFESEEIDMNDEPVSVDKLIQSVIKDFTPELEKKHIKVLYKVQTEGDFRISGDGDKLRQVFINIISNAVKFSYDEGTIDIDLNFDKSHVIVKIKDNGMGIEKKDLPFIFERLYRGDKSRQEIEGSGIGLTIVKKILMMHGADISVESEAGKGSTFTILFNRMNV